MQELAVHLAISEQAGFFRAAVLVKALHVVVVVGVLVGYYFFVAEALFLASQFVALLEWLEFTQADFPELAGLDYNVYNELLRAFYAVVSLRTGRALVSNINISLFFQLDTHSWLLDYCQVHMGLVKLHIAIVAGADMPEVDRLRSQVAEFAARYRMPFSARLAGRIT